MNASGDNKKSTNRKVVLVVVSAFAVFLLGLSAGYCAAPKNEGVSGGVDFFADAESLTDKDGETSERGVVIPGITAATVPANETEVRLELFNPIENSGAYYLTFELKVNINGKYESLYSSGLVEAGKRLNTITLSRPLAAGKYSAIVHIQPYRTDRERSATNNADIVLELTAK